MATFSSSQRTFKINFDNHTSEAGSKAIFNNSATRLFLTAPDVRPADLHPCQNNIAANYYRTRHKRILVKILKDASSLVPMPV